MTQPARKKETARQLELLEAELAAARKVTARYRTAMEKAEKRHEAAEDAQAVAQYRFDRALVASWGDTPDWMTLLDGDENRSSVMYELAREGLYADKPGDWYQISDGDRVPDHRRIPLYSIPQSGPVVKLPNEFISNEGIVVQIEKVMAVLAVAGIQYERKGNACRTVMLQGGAE